jgi:hypothetical protein
MSLYFNNNTANIKETPGFIADTFSNRPAAGNVSIGTIFIGTDNNSIYRSDGTNWSTLGGGGSTPNLQAVLTAGNTSNNIGLQIDDLINNDYFRIDTVTYGIPTIEFYNFLSSAKSNLNYGALTFYNNFANKGLYIDIFSLQTQNLTTNKYSKLYYDENRFYTAFNNGLAELQMGLLIDGDNRIYALGDNFNVQNYTKIVVNDSVPEIYINCANGQSYIGDGYNFGNNTWLCVDDLNQQLQLSGNLKSNTAGGNSGQHLKVTVGGVNYKIQLLNP